MSIMVFQKHIHQFWERWNSHILLKFSLLELKIPEHETTKRYKKTGESREEGEKKAAERVRELGT